MVGRAEFEHLEGVFHDGLGTYFELLVANRLIAEYAQAQPEFDVSEAYRRMESALTRLAGDPRRETLKEEIQRMQAAAVEAAELLREALAGQVPTRVDHCARQYAGGLAADLRLIVPGLEDVPISLKTDKSGKVALADIGQTSNLQRWFYEFFQLSAIEVEQFCLATTGLTLANARSDFQNIAHLVQAVLIRDLELVLATVNDLRHAVPSNDPAIRHLFRRVKFFKSGHDRAIVLAADRRTGKVRGDTRVDEIDPETMEISRVGFTPSAPRSHYRYGSTIGVKYDGVTIFTFQVKHQRGKGLTPERRRSFGDITTRLER